MVRLLHYLFGIHDWRHIANKSGNSTKGNHSQQSWRVCRVCYRKEKLVPVGGRDKWVWSLHADLNPSSAVEKAAKEKPLPVPTESIRLAELNQAVQEFATTWPLHDGVRVGFSGFREVVNTLDVTAIVSCYPEDAISLAYREEVTLRSIDNLPHDPDGMVYLAKHQCYDAYLKVCRRLDDAKAA